MATGQTLLNLCELLNQELQLQAGEADVVRGLIALNAAQDYFETVAAGYPNIFGGQIGSVTTTANTESTTYPTGLLRLDKMQYIDPSTSRPAWDLISDEEVGSHAWRRFWPYNFVNSTSSGKPLGYWTDGTNIYWDPLPDATNTVRYYGFKAATDITASGTFAYPDAVMLPLAAFATMLTRMGVDDQLKDIDALAKSTFDPVIEMLSKFRREPGGKGFAYRYTHNT